MRVQETGIRVIEAQSKLDIRKSLVKLERQHKDNKIQFIIIGGHGTQNSIQFGSQFKHKENLRIEDLQDERIGKNKSIFVEHPTIILNSCSTGIEGGIAQELSQKLDAETIAPDAPARIMSIKATKEGDRLNFHVTYDVGTKVYDNGQNVTTEASRLAKAA